MATKQWPWMVGAAVLGGSAVTGFVTRDYWQPWLMPQRQATADGAAQAKADPHAGHDHDDGGHAEGPVPHVDLTEQARRNLDLKIGEVTLRDYWRTVAIPGVVAEEPGHCERRISTTVNGVVTKVHALQGQSVKPGDPLFEIQPTSELLTTAQANLLKTLQELELVRAEIERIQPQVATGALARTQMIAKDAERQRLETARLVQTQELLVRGLTAEQIQTIIESRQLIRRFTVRVPATNLSDESRPHGTEPPIEQTNGTGTGTGKTSLLPVSAKAGPTALPHLTDHEHESTYTVEVLTTAVGKLVQPGEELCQLASHTVLLIEGQAFERESALVTRALENSWPITVLFESGADQPMIRKDLQILFVSNTIDVDHRTLKFFVPLANEVVRDNPGANGLMYRTWRFKPGQKVQLLLPTQQLQERIVLPADAVVKEGPDAYVFRQNGNLMERVPVTVEHLDPRDAVLTNDGSLFEGDEVALNQAYQLHLALKKAQGGGEGGHHGHDHDH